MFVHLFTILFVKRFSKLYNLVSANQIDTEKYLSPIGSAFSKINQRMERETLPIFYSRSNFDRPVKGI